MSTTAGTASTPAEALQSSDYTCPCGAVPFLENGRVTVIHQETCPQHPSRRAAQRAARRATRRGTRS